MSFVYSHLCVHTMMFEILLKLRYENISGPMQYVRELNQNFHAHKQTIFMHGSHGPRPIAAKF